MLWWFHAPHAPLLSPPFHMAPPLQLMRSMIMANPAVRSVVEANPELNSVLSNPDMLRQAMEAARDPSIMREMLRNNDQVRLFAGVAAVAHPLHGASAPHLTVLATPRVVLVASPGTAQH